MRGAGRIAASLAACWRRACGAAGLPFAELADTLLEIAFAEAAERRATTRTFESVLIAEHQRR